MTARITSSALVALVLAGCVGPRAVGHFGENAFYHARDHYRVRYLPHAPQYSLLPEGWRLESYVFDDAGRPLEASRDPRFVQLYDADTRSGRVAQVLAERFDLYFAEDSGDATMWARTMPLDGYWQGLDIAFLMRAAVAHIGRDPRAPDVLGTRGYRFLADVIGDRSARVDGHRAHAVTFDVRMPAGENSVAQRRVTVVGIEIEHHRWREGRVRRPMLLVFGYASSPSAHLATRATFERFVSRVDLR